MGPQTTVSWLFAARETMLRQVAQRSLRTSRVALRPSLVPQQRRFLATSTAANSTPGAPTNKKAAQSTGNLFLDYLGSIFLGTIGIIIASLVRSWYGSNNKNQLRDSIEAESPLDPLEMADLRTANAGLTPEIYRHVLADLRDEFAMDTEPTYDQVVEATRRSLSRLVAKDPSLRLVPTLELGHLIDRVVLSNDRPRPLLYWSVVLLLAVNAPVPDRIQLLYDSMPPERTIAHVTQVVEYLQETCQLVPEAQLLAVPERKYPIQQYKRGTAKELIQWEGTPNDPVDVDALAAILRSRSVCAWGECYHKKKFV